MSASTGEVRIRIDGSDDRSLIVEAETASDEVFNAVADERRRHVLAVISGESAPIDLPTLAERAADRLGSTDSKAVFDRLRIPLHHRHLPKMASAGLAEHDAENRTVGATRTTGA